jgi:hypothetical protein
MPFKMKYSSPLSKINEGPGDDTKKSKGKLTESQTKDLVGAINEKYGEKIPTPTGANLGKFSKYVKRSSNRLEEGGSIPTYKAAKGVTPQQFENYSKQIQASNPKIKAKFTYK